MSEVHRVKQVLVLAIGLLVAIAGLLVVRQLADVVLRASTGADPASIFNEPIQAPVELLEVIEWQPDPPRDGRRLEPTARDRITESYAQAWSSLDRSGRGDPEAPIDVYFSGPALEAAREASGSGAAVALVQLDHQLELQFYSDDGQVVALEVGARMVRLIGEGEQQIVVPSTERFDVVMLLEDGNWRIQQLTSVPAGGPAEMDDAADTRRRESVDALASMPMRGVNTVTIDGEDRTWSAATTATVEEDLDLVGDLGLDTVRVFVSGPEFAPLDIERVVLALDGAAARGQRVVLTLFDGSADHSPSRWASTPAYLERVVGTLAGHPAIAAWDLKNEPDRDDERSGGAAVVDAWLGEVADHVRRLDPMTPITIGWSTPGEATRLADRVDIVSFHHFGSADELRSSVDRLRYELGDRPLLLSEFGTATWRGLLRGEQETFRGRQLRDLIATAEDLDLAGWLVWVLRDPADPPDVGGGPWADRAELSHGVVRSDGTPRKHSVAAIVTRGTADIGAPSVAERIRGVAPTAVLLVVAAMVAAAVVVAVRRIGGRRRRLRS
jgi:hypothetical protein